MNSNLCAINYKRNIIAHYNKHSDKCELYDMKTSEKIGEIKCCDEYQTRYFTFSENGEFIAFITDINYIRIFNVDTCKEIYSIKCKSYPNCISISNDKIITVGYNNGIIDHLDIYSGKLIES